MLISLVKRIKNFSSDFRASKNYQHKNVLHDYTLQFDK